jgi:hypothetical protein
MCYRNPVSGVIKKLGETEFLSLFHVDIRETIRYLVKDKKATHVVCFECLQMDSSSLGKRTALVIGPECETCKTMEEVANNVNLGSVPSQFQYPVSYWEVEE